MKNNIRITLEYDGSRYDGWQKQGNTAHTIQGKLETVLSRMIGEPVAVQGAGRTDAGVHAYGQTASFQLSEEKPAEEIRQYLNHYLPEDIEVLRLEEAPKRFHARISAMRRAAQILLGTHDFRSFCSNKRMKKSTVRTLYDIQIQEDKEGQEIRISFTGNGFLYNMVRILTGTLIEIGQGERQPEEIRAILQAKNREAAGFTAPPQGLVLVSAEYE